MTKLTELFLKRRGLTLSDIKAINNPEHAVLFDLDKLADELKVIYDNNKHIVVLSDFDLDGITSGTILYSGLSEMGFYVSLYQPNVANGYGFDESDIKRIKEQFPDVYAIITCDVGIGCYAGIDFAKSLGIKMFITDHHGEKPANVPNFHGDVKVNPNRVDETYSNKGICGAFVAYQVVEYYAKKYEIIIINEQIRRLRVFAGLGTISDSMPLLYENRDLLRDCISLLRLTYCKGNPFFVDNLNGSFAYKQAFRGLYETLCYFAEMGKIRSESDINETFIGFYFAPLFNCIKRMNGDIFLAFGTFFSDDIKGCLDKLWELNEDRKDLVATKYLEMCEREQPYAPFIYLSDAPGGILGLLATKMIAITGMPVLVVDTDNGSCHGSGRAPIWFNMLSEFEQIGIYAEGHPGACGVGLSEDDLPKVAEFIKRRCDEIIPTLPQDIDEPDIFISLLGNGDTTIDIPLFMEFVEDLKDLSPFGRGFPAPRCDIEFKPYDAQFFTMGSEKQHLKIILPTGFEVIVWGGADSIEELKSQDVIRFTGDLGINEYMGNFTLNFIVNNG